MRKARLTHNDGETFHFAEPEPDSDAWLGLDREPEPGDEEDVRAIANGEGRRTRPMLITTRFLEMDAQVQYGSGSFVILDDLGDEYE